MNCNEARRWMGPYLDSELGHTKTFEISEHVRDCPACGVRFEAERRADELIRRKLGQGAMPTDVRQKIVLDISGGWWRQLTARRARTGGLALAACVVFAAIAIMFSPRVDSSRATPWVAQEYFRATPDNQAFEVDSQESRRGMVLLREVYKVRLMATNADDVTPEHQIQLVSATPRTDDAGRSYVEVRLNCCDQPVLLVLARTNQGPLPAPFDGLRAETLVIRSNGNNLFVGDRTSNGLAVAVASSHGVEHILQMFGA